MSKELDRFVEIYAKFKTGIDDLYTSLEAAGYTLPEDRSFANLKAPVKEIIESGGGGGGSNKVTLALSDCAQSFGEMEGITASFLRGNMNRPEFEIGSISMTYQGVTIVLELESTSLSALGGVDVPAYFNATEGVAPSGNPYMSAIFIGIGASCEAFDMSTGDMRFTEDPNSVCVVGYCAEADSVTGDFMNQPIWYFDTLEFAPMTTEQAYEKGLQKGFLGRSEAVDINEPLDIDKAISEDSYIPPYAFAGKAFKNRLTIPSKYSNINTGAFAYAFLEGGLDFEKGSWNGYSVDYGMFRGAYINSSLDLGYLENGLAPDCFVEASIQGALKYQTSAYCDTYTSWFKDAQINSVNSDEDGTYFFDASESSIHFDGACGNARKLVIKCLNLYAGFKSHRLFMEDSGYMTNTLEELYIDKLGDATTWDYDSLYLCGSIKRVVAPKVTCYQWSGGIGDGSNTPSLEYLDVYTIKDLYCNLSGALNGQSLTTLILRAENEEIVQSLDRLAYRSDCSIYVADSKLGEYQSWYSEHESSIVPKLHPISELPEA